MATKLNGFVVYLRIAVTGKFDIYTNPKSPCTREMAESLSEHLRRNKTDSIIVAMPYGEIVVERFAA